MPVASISMPGWNWVDLLLLALVTISAIVGLVRGLMFEVLSLVGWVVAWIGAQVWSGDVAAELPWGAPGSVQTVAAAFALTFLGILIGWSLAARMLRLVVHATPLRLIDRLFGAGFGLLRAVVLLLVLATLVLLSPMARSPSWQGSTGARWLTLALGTIQPWLPADLARHLPRGPDARLPMPGAAGRAT
ncbi:MAG: CvpA family protein [Aquabacterium sp.]